MNPRKKHPLFWALRKLGGDPALPKLILAFFDVGTSSKVKKLPKLRVGRGGLIWTRGNGLHVHRRGVCREDVMMGPVLKRVSRLVPHDP